MSWPIKIVTITTKVDEGGSLIDDKGNPVEEKMTITYGEEITLEASAEQHYEFDQWQSDCGDFSDQKESLTFSVMKDCDLTAIFKKVKYMITIEKQFWVVKKTVKKEDFISIDSVALSYGDYVAVGLADIDSGEYLEPYEFKESQTDCGDFSDEKETIGFTVTKSCKVLAIFHRKNYLITTMATKGGSITKSQTVSHGEEITIEAFTEDHYQFKEWKGNCLEDLSDEDETLSFKVTKDCQLEAVFEKKKTYTVTTIADQRQGSITQSQTVYYNGAVSIKATAKKAYQFKEWKSDCTHFLKHTNHEVLGEKLEREINFIVTEDCQLEAVFEKILYNITTSVSEGGVVNPKSLEKAAGETITLTASPEDAYHFIAWEIAGAACSGLPAQNPFLEFEVSGDCHLEAIFEKKKIHTVKMNSRGGGKTLWGEDRRTGDAEILDGQKIHVTAEEGDHYEFEKWESDCGDFSDHAKRGFQTGSSTPERKTLSFIVESDCTLTSVFEKKKYTVTTIADERQGTITESQKIYYNEAVSIKATAKKDHRFSEWISDCGHFSDEEKIINFIVTKDCQLEAVFVPLYQIDASSSGDGMINNQEKITIQKALGERISLVASPGENSVFDRWYFSGKNCPNPSDPNQPKIEFDVTGDCSLDAVFDLLDVPADPSPDSPAIASPVKSPAKTIDPPLATKIQTPPSPQTPPSSQNSNVKRVPSQTVFNSDCPTPLYLDGMTVKAHDCVKKLIGNKKGMTLPLYRSDGTSVDYWVIGEAHADALSHWVKSHPFQSDKVCTSFVQDMNALFLGNPFFNGDISSWDVSQVKDMNRMFHSASAFNQDISHWDVSQVTDMRKMFYKAKKFNQNIGSWDVSQVTDMHEMFFEAKKFNGDISTWNISQVTNIGWMFGYALSFDQYIGDWDISKVTEMRGLFLGAKVFNKDLSPWNVSHITSMIAMFSKTEAFNQDLSRWDVSSVKNMGGMFFEASAFNQNIGGWDVSNVTNMDAMFGNASKFNQDLSQWNVSNVTSMKEMFLGAKVFNRDLSGWNVSNVTKCGAIFSVNEIMDETRKPRFTKCNPY